MLHMMDIKKLIIQQLKRTGEARVADLTKRTGFSRAYIHRFFQELQRVGTITITGRANQTRYVRTKQFRARLIQEVRTVHKILKNRDLDEDRVLDDIKKETGIFLNIPKSVARILDYASTEMLNNAIEHSGSKKIELFMRRDGNEIRFSVRDWGIGIFRHIMRTRKLKNNIEAIQDLLKGKQTTAPESHTGEGIFFTSKAADTLEIKSGEKSLLFNNFLRDVFVRDVAGLSGTKVSFLVTLRTKRTLEAVFGAYAGEGFAFSKTKVAVALYKMGDIYISRSQARRIVSGLEKFKEVALDFANVTTVGQAFADEIFRVWQQHHPHIRITSLNANENVIAMIQRARM